MGLSYKPQVTRAATVEELNRFVATADELGHHSIGTAALIAFWWLQQEEVVEARFLGNDHDIADIPPRPGGGVLNRPHTTPT